MMYVTVKILSLVLAFHSLGIIPLSTMDAQPFPLVLAQNQDQEATQNGEIALEQARIVEKVRRDYEQALIAYEALLGSSPAQEILEQAALGMSRCYTKLGRYGEARNLLNELLKSEIPEEVRNQANDVLKEIKRRSISEGLGDSSVNYMVCQLLEATLKEGDSKRQNAAQYELLKMGNLAVPMLKKACLDDDYYLSVKAFTVLFILMHNGEEEIKAFLDECARNQSLAIRKRCLDGWIAPRKFRFKDFSMLEHYLRDEEELLRHDARSFLFRFHKDILRAYNENRDALSDSLNELKLVLEEIARETNPEQRCRALDAATNYAYFATHYCTETFPAVSFLPLVEDALSELRNPESFLVKWEGYDETVRRAVEFAIAFDFQPLLKKTTNFGMHYCDSSLRAANQLGPETLEEIARKILSKEDPSLIHWLCRRLNKDPELCDAFKSFSIETQKELLKTCYKSGSTRDFPEPPSDLSVPVWCAMMESLLKNPKVRFSTITSDALITVPDPQDPECMDLLIRWAGHPDNPVRSLLFKTISQLVEEKRMDPGPDGALLVMEGLLEAMSDPIEVRLDRSHLAKGYIAKVTPTALFGLFSQLIQCIETGDCKTVQDWLLNQNKPGLLDAVAASGDLVWQLANNDHEFLAELWSRIGPTPRCILFNEMIEWNREIIDSARISWIVPIIKDWDIDESPYFANYLDPLLSLLSFQKDPAYTPLIKKIALLILKDPELQTRGRIVSLAKILTSVDPASIELMDIYPFWYQNLNIGIADNLNWSFQSSILYSNENLTRAFDWLVSDFDDSFKLLIVRQFEPSNNNHQPIDGLGFDGLYQKVWPMLDDDKIKDALYEKAFSFRELNNNLTGFFSFILTDQTAANNYRYMAYYILINSSKHEAIDPLISFMREFDPCEGDFLLCDPSCPRSWLQKAIKLEGHYFRENDEVNKSFNFKKRISKFGEEGERRFCMGILGLPTEQPILQKAALLCNFVIKNDEEFNIIRNAYDFNGLLHSRSKMLELMVDYLLKTRHKGKSASTVSTSEVDMVNQNEAISLIEEAMSDHHAYRALELISEYRLKQFQPLVENTALTHPVSYTRSKAVEALTSLGDIESILPVLRQCLKDHDQTVREAANAVLDRFREQEEQLRAWDAFWNQGEPKVSPIESLAEMLDNDDLEVRIAAIRSLAKLGKSEALPLLVKIMAEGDPAEKRAAKAAIDTILEK